MSLVPNKVSGSVMLLYSLLTKLIDVAVTGKDIGTSGEVAGQLIDKCFLSLCVKTSSLAT